MLILKTKVTFFKETQFINNIKSIIFYYNFDLKCLRVLVKHLFPTDKLLSREINGFDRNIYRYTI